MSESELPEEAGTGAETNPSPEQPEVRAPWTWAVLVGIFVILVVSQLVVKKPGQPTSEFDETESVIKLKTLMTSKHGLSTSTAATQNQWGLPSTDESLKKLRADLNPDAAKDPLAARIALSVDFELGKAPEPKLLSLLEKSESEADKEYAQVYAADSLDPGWVAKVRGNFPKNFLGRVVLAHAQSKAGDTQALNRMVRASDRLGVIGLALGLGFVLLFGLIVLASLLFAALSGQLKPVGHPLIGLSRADADRLALRMAVFMVLLVFVPSLFVLALEKAVGREVAMVIGEVALFTLLVYFLKFEVLGKADTFRRLVGRTNKWPMLALYGIIGFVGSVPVTVVLALSVQAVFKDAPRPSHPLQESVSIGASPIALVMMYVLVSVMAPLIEETTFRGILFPALSRYLSPAASILLSGFMFGAIHPQGPLLWAALGGIGAVAALLSYLTGSLIPSMVMHACQNFCVLTLSVVLLY